MKWLSATIVLCVIASSYGQNYTTVGNYTGKLTVGTLMNCGVHLVHESFVVTSAHCLEASNATAIKIGKAVFKGIRTHKNENYKASSRDADVALVRISNGIKFNATITKTVILNCTAAPVANAVVKVLSLNGASRNATIMSDISCQWKTMLLYTHVICLNEVQLLAPYETIWSKGKLYGISTLTPGVFTRLCTYDQMLAGAIAP
ncbi:unnamed protein product [Diamesa serratosioi]